MMGDNSGASEMPEGLQAFLAQRAKKMRSEEIGSLALDLQKLLKQAEQAKEEYDEQACPPAIAA